MLIIITICIHVLLLLSLLLYCSIRFGSREAEEEMGEFEKLVDRFSTKAYYDRFRKL